LLTFACVVAVHALLFTVNGDSVIGFGLIHLLHFTREVFFALTAFVLCYTSRNRNMRARTFWKRRLAAILPTYIVWNLVYTAAACIDKPRNVEATLRLALSNLEYGYYHLYFLLVTMQIYLLFPALLWLLRKTASHHLALVLISGALQLALMFCIHEQWPTGELARTFRHWCTSSRFVFAYQFYIVAGALAGLHYERFHSWATERTKLLAAFFGLAFGLTVGVFALAVHSGTRPGGAANIFQPVIVPWAIAVALALYLLGNVWTRRKRMRRFVLWGSEASFGIYLAHPLVLMYLLPALSLDTNHRALAEPWDTLLALLLAAMIAAGTTQILRRSPVARIALGRDRAKTAPAATGLRSRVLS
jgi:peptidoglycan/LPS O-acetylase OafA/YrhL